MTKDNKLQLIKTPILREAVQSLDSKEDKSGVFYGSEGNPNQWEITSKDSKKVIRIKDLTKKSYYGQPITIYEKVFNPENQAEFREFINEFVPNR